jgi:hypothetical protein
MSRKGIMGSLRASVFSRDAVIGAPLELDAQKTAFDSQQDEPSLMELYSGKAGNESTGYFHTKTYFCSKGRKTTI